jgi:TRAP-type uncharacterized transport system fused permease subunit
MTEADPVLPKARIEELVEQFEAPTRSLAGGLGRAATAAAVAMSLFALYAAVETINALTVRSLHLLFALGLIFLFYPAARRFRGRVNWWDWVLLAAAVASVGYVVWLGDDLQFCSCISVCPCRNLMH